MITQPPAIIFNQWELPVLVWNYLKKKKTGKMFIFPVVFENWVVVISGHSLIIVKWIWGFSPQIYEYDPLLSPISIRHKGVLRVKHVC